MEGVESGGLGYLGLGVGEGWDWVSWVCCGEGGNFSTCRRASYRV